MMTINGFLQATVIAYCHVWILVTLIYVMTRWLNLFFTDFSSFHFILWLCFIRFHMTLYVHTNGIANIDIYSLVTGYFILETWIWFNSFKVLKTKYNVKKNITEFDLYWISAYDKAQNVISKNQVQSYNMISSFYNVKYIL